MKFKDIKSIVINGYESNSYQVYHIFINNELVYKSKIMYGYDTHFEYMALEYIKQNVLSKYMLSKHNITAFWHLRDLGITALAFKHYVNNKELKNREG